MRRLQIGVMGSAADMAIDLGREYLRRFERR